MATASNPDSGQFGSAPGPAPYPPGQNYQPDNGHYPPPPPPYGAPPTYPSFTQNQLFASTPYQPGMSQQTTYYVLGSVQPVVTQHYVPVKESYAGHIAFACFVFWCCGWLFGGIAFILAMIASNSSGDGHRTDAKRLGQASLAMSSVGVILGLVAWGLIIWAIVASATTDYHGSGGGGSSCSYYTCGGNCYYYRSYYTYSQCSYYTSSCYSSSTGYCYYNY